MGRCKPGINDLATVDPELASEWHPTENGNLKPSMFAVNSHVKVQWLGKCGHSFPGIIKNRHVQKTGCPYCSNQKLLQGFNDLKTRFPKLAEEWDYNKNERQPNEVIAGGNTSYNWLCQLGHSWSSSIADRKRGDGCPYCSNKRLLIG